VRRFHEGDHVRIDIPFETDPDFERLHGETGEVVDSMTPPMKAEG